jgi:hypothetical protein
MLDLSEPEPTIYQELMMEEARDQNLTDLIIEDINPLQEELFIMAIEKGVPVMRKFANFSRSLKDITVHDSQAATSVVHWYEQNLMDGSFKDDLKYIGPLFKALVDLNFYGRLHPQYD